jgi:hypothetical protein
MAANAPSSNAARFSSCGPAARGLSRLLLNDVKDQADMSAMSNNAAQLTTVKRQLGDNPTAEKRTR